MMKNNVSCSQHTDFFTRRDQRDYMLISDHLVFLPKYLVR